MMFKLLFKSLGNWLPYINDIMERFLNKDWRELDN